MSKLLLDENLSSFKNVCEDLVFLYFLLTREGESCKPENSDYNETWHKCTGKRGKYINLKIFCDYSKMV